MKNWKNFFYLLLLVPGLALGQFVKVPVNANNGNVTNTYSSAVYSAARQNQTLANNTWVLDSTDHVIMCLRYYTCGNGKNAGGHVTNKLISRWTFLVDDLAEHTGGDYSNTTYFFWTTNEVVVSSNAQLYTNWSLFVKTNTYRLPMLKYIDTHFWTNANISTNALKYIITDYSVYYRTY